MLTKKDMALIKREAKLLQNNVIDAYIDAKGDLDRYNKEKEVLLLMSLDYLLSNISYTRDFGENEIKLEEAQDMLVDIIKW